MQTSYYRLLRLGGLAALLAALLVASAIGHALGAQAAPPTASLPASTCTLSGTTRSCELWAKAGTISLPGATSLPIWGYSDSASGAAGLPGPALIVNQGETVQVTLHNTLAQASALAFPGQALAPDLVGAPSGGIKTYSFVASQPGTFLYEAGLTSNGARQVAMGLYGALIVRPATAGQAYDSTASAYDDEALLVASEIDPSLNNAPSTFAMQGYNPRYWLLNGKVFPSTDAIATAAGNRVLLRYVNAGLQPRSLGLLGLRQAVLGVDGRALPYARTVIAETMGAGQTLDAIATIPAAATTGTKYALYNTNGQPRNASQRTGGVLNFGGMLAFLTVGAGTTPTDTAGPVASAASVAPSPTNGMANVALSATISDQSTGGANVTAAEYFIDTVGASGSGTAMDGTFGGASASVSASVSTATLATLASGNHTFYIHGQDSNGNWGPLVSAVLNLDKAGPPISGGALTPAYSNGATSVDIQATASDTASGNGNVTNAEYFIGAPGADGSGTPLALNQVAPIASLTGTIPAVALGALADGAYTVNIHARDALGNWGAYSALTLLIDKSGPAGPTAVSASPNPNNGVTGYNSSVNALRFFATVSDAGTPVAAAEGFIDTLGATGAGFPLQPVDGQFGGTSEAMYADIPLGTVSLLAPGNHTLYVRGKDAAGNWGATSSITLLIDKTAPTFSGITLVPNPTLGAASVTLTINGAADSGGAGVAGGEYWLNPPTTAAPAPGGGTPFSGTSASIPVGALTPGSYTVSVRIKDAAGNWSSGANGIRSATLTVMPDAIFSNGFETGGRPWGWSSASTNNTSQLNVGTPALEGTRSLLAQGNGAYYVQYNFGTAANPATATFDARFYFNPNNNASTGQDILAARNGTTTIFRVRYRRNGAQPQVQIQVGSTNNTSVPWINITNNASNRIEVIWQAGGTLALYVNGTTVSQSLTATNSTINSVRLGSVTSGGSSTLMYFDAFAAKRSVVPLIGP